MNKEGSLCRGDCSHLGKPVAARICGQLHDGDGQVINQDIK